MGNVYKSIELVGVSKQSFDEAARVAVRRAGETMRNLRWLEMVEQRAYIAEGEIEEFQVKVRIWFELDSEDQ